MKRALLLPAVAVLVSLAAGAQSGKTARGRYLTEDVAQCQECHTPRLANGKLDRSAWLKGSGRAPDITSSGAVWQRWGEKGMVQYLETGKDPAGASSTAHMPAFRLRPDDAEAIGAWLKSLK
jgi:mono/diheme cytochrome c family protein